MVDEQPWHTLTEAAAVSGLAREAIRARVRRGLITSRKGNRGELLVQLPAGPVAEVGQGEAAARVEAAHDAAAARVSAAKVEVLAELRRPWWSRLIGRERKSP